MQRKQLRFGVIPFTMPTIPPLPAARQLHLLGLLMVALTICAGCASKAEKPAPPPPGVTITPAILKDVPIHQEWVGTMSGNIDAEIRPKVDGFLLSKLYLEGSYVEKGAPMFQLDKRQAEAAVEQAKGNLERARAALGQAQIDVRRYTPLVAQKAVSQAELDKALSAESAGKAGVDANQAVLDNAMLNLGWTTVACADFGNRRNFQMPNWGPYDADNGHDNHIQRESDLRRHQHR